MNFFCRLYDALNWQYYILRVLVELENVTKAFNKPFHVIEKKVGFHGFTEKKIVVPLFTILYVRKTRLHCCLTPGFSLYDIILETGTAVKVLL